MSARTIDNEFRRLTGLTRAEYDAIDTDKVTMESPWWVEAKAKRIRFTHLTSGLTFSVGGDGAGEIIYFGCSFGPGDPATAGPEAFPTAAKAIATATAIFLNGGKPLAPWFRAAADLALLGRRAVYIDVETTNQDAWLGFIVKHARPGFPVNILLGGDGVGLRVSAEARSQPPMLNLAALRRDAASLLEPSS